MMDLIEHVVLMKKGKKCFNDLMGVDMYSVLIGMMMLKNHC